MRGSGLPPQQPMPTLDAFPPVSRNLAHFFLGFPGSDASPSHPGPLISSPHRPWHPDYACCQALYLGDDAIPPTARPYDTTSLTGTGESRFLPELFCPLLRRLHSPRASFSPAWGGRKSKGGQDTSAGRDACGGAGRPGPEGDGTVSTARYLGSRWSRKQALHLSFALLCLSLVFVSSCCLSLITRTLVDECPLPPPLRLVSTLR